MLNSLKYVLISYLHDSWVRKYIDSFHPAGISRADRCVRKSERAPAVDEVSGDLEKPGKMRPEEHS